MRQQGGSETAVKLDRLSRELYLRLGERLGLDSGFTETGYYIVAETEEEKEGFLRLVEVRREAGVKNEWIEGSRTPDMETLKSGPVRLSCRWHSLGDNSRVSSTAPANTFHPQIGYI